HRHRCGAGTHPRTGAGGAGVMSWRGTAEWTVSREMQVADVDPGGESALAAAAVASRAPTPTLPRGRGRGYQASLRFCPLPRLRGRVGVGATEVAEERRQRPFPQRKTRPAGRGPARMP